MAATNHIGLSLTPSQRREILISVGGLIVLHFGDGAVVLVLAKQESCCVCLVEVEVVEPVFRSSNRHRVAVEAAQGRDVNVRAGERPVQNESVTTEVRWVGKDEEG